MNIIKEVTECGKGDMQRNPVSLIVDPLSLLNPCPYGIDRQFHIELLIAHYSHTQFKSQQRYSSPTHSMCLGVQESERCINACHHVW